jgi:hypothetical protein
MSKPVTKDGAHLGHSQVETQINTYVQDNMIHRCHSRLQQTKRHYIVRFFSKTCCDHWLNLFQRQDPQTWSHHIMGARPSGLRPARCHFRVRSSYRRSRIPTPPVEFLAGPSGDGVRIHPEGRWQFPKLRLQTNCLNIYKMFVTPTQDHRIFVAQIWKNWFGTPGQRTRKRHAKLTNKTMHSDFTQNQWRAQNQWHAQ